MQTSHLENEEIKTLTDATAVLKKARRDYRMALARIKHAERFLADRVEGLMYEKAGKIYGPDSFVYPPRRATLNGDRQIATKYYTLYFGHDDTGWHFWIAPTLEDGEGPVLLNDRAKRLIDAPAGLVLSCAEGIESDAVVILEHLAALLKASYDHTPASGPPRTPAPGDETRRCGMAARGSAKVQLN